MNFSPLKTALAISLYQYNVSPAVRAAKLYDHFNGDCAEIEELLNWCMRGYVTDMPLPTADIYVKHALHKYGDEAKKRASYLNNNP